MQEAKSDTYPQEVTDSDTYPHGQGEDTEPPQTCSKCGVELRKGDRQCRGMCHTCYERLRRNGSLVVINRPDLPSLDKLNGIDKKLKKYGDGKKCFICGITLKKRCGIRGLCKKCYGRVQRGGFVESTYAELPSLDRMIGVDKYQSIYGSGNNCFNCNIKLPHGDKSRGLCISCYARALRCGLIEPIKIRVNDDWMCKCGSTKHHSGGLCEICYYKKYNKKPNVRKHKSEYKKLRYHSIPRIRMKRAEYIREYQRRPYRVIHRKYKRRMKRIERHGYEYCLVCGITINLHEHHLQYIDEGLPEIVLLCKFHHGMQPKKTNSTPIEEWNEKNGDSL